MKLMKTKHYKQNKTRENWPVESALKQAAEKRKRAGKRIRKKSATEHATSLARKKKVKGGEYGKIPLQTLEQSLSNLTFSQTTRSPPKSRENKNPVLEDS